MLKYVRIDTIYISYLVIATCFDNIYMVLFVSVKKYSCFKAKNYELN